MVKVFPAIVIIPVRAEVVAFAATENPTAPVPELLAPLVTVIQLALLTADQAQAASDAVTVTLPELAVAETDTSDEEIV